MFHGTGCNFRGFCFPNSSRGFHRISRGFVFRISVGCGLRFCFPNFRRVRSRFRISVVSKFPWSQISVVSVPNFCGSPDFPGFQFRISVVSKFRFPDLVCPRRNSSSVYRKVTKWVFLILLSCSYHYLRNWLRNDNYTLFFISTSKLKSRLAGA